MFFKYLLRAILKNLNYITLVLAHWIMSMCFYYTQNFKTGRQAIVFGVFVFLQGG